MVSYFMDRILTVNQRFRTVWKHRPQGLENVVLPAHIVSSLSFGAEWRPSKDEFFSHGEHR